MFETVQDLTKKQILIKDGDDARTLIATVLVQSFIVESMFGAGLI